MAVSFRNYTSETFHTEDYVKVREFLIRINAEKLYTPRFLWGAWEWAITHSYRDNTYNSKIGMWEDDGKLVALADYEIKLGYAFLMVDEAYAHLKPEMIAYAKENLSDKGNIKILINDGDYEFQRAALGQGFRMTQNRDFISVLDIDNIQSYALPEGFSFVSMADEWSWQQYNRVLHRGFNHEGRPNHDAEKIASVKRGLSSPMIIPELVVCVKAPDGNYVSHCGMWYKPDEHYCYVEPVATDPHYRKMGLGKAVVLEAIKRCGKLGAKQALVTTGQQFYYNIGFYTVSTTTYWEPVKNSAD